MRELSSLEWSVDSLEWSRLHHSHLSHSYNNSSRFPPQLSLCQYCMSERWFWIRSGFDWSRPIVVKHLNPYATIYFSLCMHYMNSVFSIQKEPAVCIESNVLGWDNLMEIYLENDNETNGWTALTDGWIGR